MSLLTLLHITLYPPNFSTQIEDQTSFVSQPWFTQVPFFGQEIRESRVLQWVRPRAAAVKSLRLRGGEDGRGRKEMMSHPRDLVRRLHDFTGYAVPSALDTRPSRTDVC